MQFQKMTIIIITIKRAIIDNLLQYTNIKTTSELIHTDKNTHFELMGSLRNGKSFLMLKFLILKVAQYSL